VTDYRTPTGSTAEAVSLREQLSAYLDGELDDAARGDVELRIASDPALCEELRRLSKVWECLDDLPRAEADAAFTQTTVEIVALSAQKQIERRRGWLSRTKLMEWGVFGLVFLIAGMLGAVAADLSSPTKDELLFRDLPVIRNLDKYKAVGSVEFLRELHRQGLFPDDN
jgi:anti-sigma factor RsiW